MGNTVSPQNTDNIVKVDFTNCPSFSKQYINYEPEESNLPILIMAEESKNLPEHQLQLGGGDPLSSFGFNDHEIHTINKYTNKTDTEFNETPNSSYFYPKKHASLARIEKNTHGTESTSKPNKKNIETDDLENIDENDLDDSDSEDLVKNNKHRMSRYVRTSSQNPYNRTIKSVINRSNKKNTESSVNVLPTYD